MSNLYKSRNIKCTEADARLIDNNALISEKIEKIKNSLKETISHEEAETDEILNGFTTGLDAEVVDALTMDREENFEEEAEQIISQANNEAEEILNKARLEAENLMARIKKEAWDEAYAQAVKKEG